jgi:hypothetical protein
MPALPGLPGLPTPPTPVIVNLRTLNGIAHVPEELNVTLPGSARVILRVFRARGILSQLLKLFYEFFI